MGRILSLLMLTMLLSAAWVGTVQAVGTCTITEMCDPAEDLTGSLRAATIVRGIGIAVLAIVVILAAFAHFGAGLIGIVGTLMLLGIWFQAEAVADRWGWTGLGF